MDQIKINKDGNRFINGDLETKRQMVAHGFKDINFQEKAAQRLSALHFAARYGNLDTIKYLIQIGADLNIQDKDGNTAIHLALFEPNGYDSPSTNPNIFFALVGINPIDFSPLDYMGADPFIVNNYGTGPFRWAERYNKKNRLKDVIRFYNQFLEDYWHDRKIKNFFYTVTALKELSVYHEIDCSSLIDFFEML
jgi:ankyrin repeat protein